MNNSMLLASFSPEAFNNWMLLFVTILFAGSILFLIGLYVGRRFWIRFEDLSDQMDLDNQKRNLLLEKQRKHFVSIQESLEITR